jgi:hypothetical protein
MLMIIETRYLSKSTTFFYTTLLVYDGTLAFDILLTYKNR